MSEIVLAYALAGLDQEVFVLERQTLITGVSLNRVVKQTAKINIFVIGNLYFDIVRNIVNQVIVIVGHWIIKNCIPEGGGGERVPLPVSLENCFRVKAIVIEGADIDLEGDKTLYTSAERTVGHTGSPLVGGHLANSLLPALEAPMVFSFRLHEIEACTKWTIKNSIIIYPKKVLKIIN